MGVRAPETIASRTPDARSAAQRRSVSRDMTPWWCRGEGGGEERRATVAGRVARRHRWDSSVGTRRLLRARRLVAGAAPRIQLRARSVRASMAVRSEHSARLRCACCAAVLVAPPSLLSPQPCPPPCPAPSLRSRSSQHGPWWMAAGAPRQPTAPAGWRVHVGAGLLVAVWRWGYTQRSQRRRGAQHAGPWAGARGGEHVLDAARCGHAPLPGWLDRGSAPTSRQCP